MLALLEGVDAVVHLGGVSTEKPFEPILQANIVGMFNLYEAARMHGVKRIVFASSNHVTGFYRQRRGRSTPRDAGAARRLSTACSKAFGENLAQFYFDRYGIETVSLRIGSSFAEPKDRRMLATWLSFDDLERLVVASLTAPVVGHTRHLRHVRQRRRPGGTTRPRGTSATGRRTAPSRSAPRSRRASRRSTPTQPVALLPRRRLRDQRPVRIRGDTTMKTMFTNPCSLSALAGAVACAAQRHRVPLGRHPQRRRLPDRGRGQVHGRAAREEERRQAQDQGLQQAARWAARRKPSTRSRSARST